MGEKHAPAAVASEPDLIQQLTHVGLLVQVHDLVLELLPLVGDHLPAAEAPHWDYHFTNFSKYYPPYIPYYTLLYILGHWSAHAYISSIVRFIGNAPIPGQPGRVQNRQPALTETAPILLDGARGGSQSAQRTGGGAAAKEPSRQAAGALPTLPQTEGGGEITETPTRGS